MKNYEEVRKNLLTNPRIKKEYDSLEAEYQLIRAVIRMRKQTKMSQKKLAGQLATKQSVISRFERGFSNPTIAFISKLASAFGKKLVIEFR